MAEMGSGELGWEKAMWEELQGSLDGGLAFPGQFCFPKRAVVALNEIPYLVSPQSM